MGGFEMQSALDFFIKAVEESANIINPEEFSHLGKSFQPDDKVLNVELDFQLQQLLAVLLQKNHEIKLAGEEAGRSLDEKLREIGTSCEEIFHDPCFCPAEKIEKIEKELPGIKEQIDAIFASKEGYAVQEILPNLMVAGMMLRIIIEEKYRLSDVPFEIRGIKYLVIPKSEKKPETTEANGIRGDRQVTLIFKVPSWYNPENN